MPFHNLLWALSKNGVHAAIVKLDGVAYVTGITLDEQKARKIEDEVNMRYERFLEIVEQEKDDADKVRKKYREFLNLRFRELDRDSEE
jgi:hypothetical protein